MTFISVSGCLSQGGPTFLFLLIFVIIFPPNHLRHFLQCPLLGLSKLSRNYNLATPNPLAFMEWTNQKIYKGILLEQRTKGFNLNQLNIALVLPSFILAWLWPTLFTCRSKYFGSIYLLILLFDKYRLSNQKSFRQLKPQLQTSCR